MLKTRKELVKDIKFQLYKMIKFKRSAVKHCALVNNIMSHTLKQEDTAYV